MAFFCWEKLIKCIKMKVEECVGKRAYFYVGMLKSRTFACVVCASEVHVLVGLRVETEFKVANRFFHCRRSGRDSRFTCFI